MVLRAPGPPGSPLAVRWLRSAEATDLHLCKVAPIGLGLLSRKGAQAQIGLGLLARLVAGDHMAEVTAVARYPRSQTIAWSLAAVRVGNASRVSRMNGR